MPATTRASAARARTVDTPVSDERADAPQGAQAQQARLESLVRAEYERLNPEDSFDHLKRRARFSKEDKGTLAEWMALATARAAGVPPLPDAPPESDFPPAP